jgi:hypothetical protein
MDGPKGPPATAAGPAARKPTIADRWEEAVDDTFYRIGWAVSSPLGAVISIATTFILGGALSGVGQSFLKAEDRPDRLWVPAGSVSLEQDEYIGTRWNSTSRFAFHILGCPPDKADCNILEPDMIRKIDKLYEEIDNLRLDGDWLADELVKYWVDEQKSEFVTAEDFEKYRGLWTFSIRGTPKLAPERNVTDALCFKFGPICAKQNILQLFGDGDHMVLDRLDKKGSLTAVNFWNKQKVNCMVSIAREDSPCIDPQKWLPDAATWTHGEPQQDDCQKYDCLHPGSHGARRLHPGSPCVHEPTIRCMNATDAYCAIVCPAAEMNFRDPGFQTAMDTCEDFACIQQVRIAEIFTEGRQDDAENVDTVASSSFCGVPEPWPVANILGEETLAESGEITGAKYVMGWHAIENRPTNLEGPRRTGTDPLAQWFEAELLCIFGVTAMPDFREGRTLPYVRNATHVTPLKETCEPLIDFTYAGFTQRSFADLFGAVILGDVLLLVSALYMMVGYLLLTLGSTDHVHSGMGLACVAIMTVYLSYGCGIGLGAMLGLYDQVLNQQIQFLLLGLGVDDAFVLVGQFAHATKLEPDSTVQRRCALMCQKGGVSIFITSLTDAIALLIGSWTVLPALSWFCGFAGLCVAFCFLFQLTIITPAIALNAMRAEKGALDCFCCGACCPEFLKCCLRPKRGENKYDDMMKPKGCFLAELAVCSVVGAAVAGAVARFTPSEQKTVGYALAAAIAFGGVAVGCFLRGRLCWPCKLRPNNLEIFLRDGFGERVATKKHGQIATILLFAVATLVGFYGTSQMYSDFRLEWFIPDNNYVANFLSMNEDLFSTGTDCSVYFTEPDYAAKQPELQKVSAFLKSSPVIDQDEAPGDWHGDFVEWLQETVADPDDPRYGVSLADGKVGEALGPKGYYGLLFQFLASCDGSRHRTAVKWQDDYRCKEYISDEPDPDKYCDYEKGLVGARSSFTIRKRDTTTGSDRFLAMTQLRDDLEKIFPDVGEAFAFGRDFLYWEEVGVIRGELVRNLLICAVVVCTIVCLMIPRPKLAGMTLMCIILSIVNVLGFAYFWWDDEKRPHTTINGTSTIYILIACGLAVDYSAHIAHAFNNAKGSANERVLYALEVIGPCVFHGFVTLMLATVPLSQSVTYVFRTFFKMFFLVALFGGCHGLFLLPVLLAVFGGDNGQLVTKRAVTPPKGGGITPRSEDEKSQVSV